MTSKEHWHIKLHISDCLYGNLRQVPQQPKSGGLASTALRLMKTNMTLGIHSTRIYSYTYRTIPHPISRPCRASMQRANVTVKCKKRNWRMQVKHWKKKLQLAILRSILLLVAIGLNGYAACCIEPVRCCS